MKKLFFLLFITCMVIVSCDTNTSQADIEKFREEIRSAERAFADMAAEKGTADAFATFADESAVILRGNTIIAGKEQIAKTFEDQPFTDIKLEWEPDFIDVSSSGDLGYTYGKFTFSAIDSTGNKIESNGIFHTVWKRQPDGSWKYVWD